MTKTTRRAEDKQTRHMAEFVKAWWFLIVAGVGMVGAMITMYTELQYVVKAVNPDSLAKYGVEQAKLAQKRQIRWCLGKLIISGPVEVKKILECAD